ncbi:hypothetical protein NE237_029301 [Protea cynaroides]|uniref:EF-hand domain-containing protein n=1 Tax=Protea cynaroides TaxID=273540 RepID=A0A9Q0GRY3_9MAGN|nr:hypothetical protein NE237_029301 [Protea cynaroides]
MCPLCFSDLEMIFTRLDHDNDGIVSTDEIMQLLNKIGIQINAKEVDEIVGRTTLDLQEFVSFYESISVQVEGRDSDDEERELLDQAFKVFDLNNDGFICSEELQIVLFRLGLLGDSSELDCQKMISRFDMNSDGKLDFEEFKNMILLTNDHSRSYKV